MFRRLRTTTTGYTQRVARGLSRPFPDSETPLFDATVLATGVMPREHVSSIAYPDYPNDDPLASRSDLGRMARLDALAGLASPLTAEASR